jgi:hypothetical protein
MFGCVAVADQRQFRVVRQTSVTAADGCGPGVRFRSSAFARMLRSCSHTRTGVGAGSACWPSWCSRSLRCPREATLRPIRCPSRRARCSRPATRVRPRHRCARCLAMLLRTTNSADPSPVPLGVTVVARDSTAQPAGEYAICYVNAFQTQPGQFGWWRTRHPDLLLRHRGRPVADANWPDEVLLDIGTRAHRRVLARIVDRSFRVCERKGFDAVEPTTSTRGLAAVACFSAPMRSPTPGCSCAAPMLAVWPSPRRTPCRWRSDGVSWGGTSPWPRSVRCTENATASRGPTAVPVIEIEYDDAGGRANFTAACAARGAQIAIVYRDRDLVPAGRPGHVYDSC